MSAETYDPCPHCGSDKVSKANPGGIALLAIGTAGCIVWIPVLGWIAAPILAIIALGAGIYAMTPKGKRALVCSSCRKFHQPAR